MQGAKCNALLIAELFVNVFSCFGLPCCCNLAGQETRQSTGGARPHLHSLVLNNHFVRHPGRSESRVTFASSSLDGLNCREGNLTSSVKFHELSRPYHGVISASWLLARVITAFRPSFHGSVFAGEWKWPGPL